MGNAEIKTIILDFDGVVVESVGIKDRAFEALFKEYTDHFEAIMQYHLDNNATIRWEKFEHIYENILGREYTENIKEDLSTRYSEIVVSQIKECPSVPGAEEFLSCFFEKIPLYIASVNPLEELKGILKARAIAHYFTDIYAVPWKKKDAICDILKKGKLTEDQAVFIGDSPEDYEAARAANIQFIGRKTNKSFVDTSIPVFEDFYEIKDYLLTNNMVANV